MKKFLIFALLFIPMTSFAASSVRVLGTKTATPGVSTTTSAKVVPAKTTATKTGDTSVSRIGTVRPKTTKTTTGTVSNTASVSGSRFPVITPVKSYNTVTTPKQENTGSAVVPSQVDTTEIVDRITNILNENYVQKEEVNTIIQQNLDDPRFDAIVVTGNANYDPVAKWAAKGKTLPEGYVYMWVEE